MIQIQKMRDVLYSYTDPNFSFSSVYLFFFIEDILGMLHVFGSVYWYHSLIRFGKCYHI